MHCYLLPHSTAVPDSCTELLDHSDPYSCSDTSTPLSGVETEFEDKARYAFLNHCKGEPLLEECVNVDDCNIGLVTEVETDYNPVASDEEVTVSSECLEFKPLSRKRRRRVSVIVLSDDEGQSTRDVSSRKRPPRKKKRKESALVPGTHSSGDGHDGDDELECASVNTVSSDPTAKEICSLCVVGTEFHGDATHPFPYILSGPLSQTLCSCCQPAPIAATVCTCPSCVDIPCSDSAAGYMYVSREGLHSADQVEYSTAPSLSVEESYPCNTVVLDSCVTGPCGQLGCGCHETGPNFTPNLFYSFVPTAVQPCNCIDCAPLP